MLHIKNLKDKFFISITVLIFAGVLYYFSIPCIFLNLTGIRCLGCGMTRALVCAIKLDFTNAFSYHIMFWSVPFLYLAFLLDGKLFKQKWLNILFYCVTAIGFLINWFVKVFF